uniref:Uncharacterized protein n=1 Tax=Anguilla anguilla TaxID=7936 RepID=A0A0E9XID1_ANGAN
MLSEVDWSLKTFNRVESWLSASVHTKTRTNVLSISSNELSEKPASKSSLPV